MAFSGYPEHAEAAAAALGCDRAAYYEALKQPGLTRAGSLVSQALSRPEGPDPDTVRVIDDILAGLAVATAAVAAMRQLVGGEPPAFAVSAQRAAVKKGGPRG